VNKANQATHLKLLLGRLMIYFQTFMEASSALAQDEETVVTEMFEPHKTLGMCWRISR